MRVGVIGTPAGLGIYRRWLEQINNFIPAMADAPHHAPYPGFEAAFRTKWSADVTIYEAVSSVEISNAIRKSDRHNAVWETVGIFANRIVERLRSDDASVDLWFVVIPDEVWRLGRPLSRPTRAESIIDPMALGAKRGLKLLREPSLFEEDMRAAEVYRYHVNFHHQLKARLLEHKAVVQVVRESSLSFGNMGVEVIRRRLQDPATLAWNLTTTSFFKAGGRPWKIANVRPGVCYVGLVFKIQSTPEDRQNACCGAQMFLDSGDGLVFKGAVGPWYSADSKQFHLSRSEAQKLIQQVVSSYSAFHGRPPSELFIHGRTRFNQEEWEGFQEGAGPETKVVCVRISRSQEMKAFRPGRTPVLRGTSLALSDRTGFLWTAGYIPELATYPGREVPNPLMVDITRGEADLEQVMTDVMGLTKVNFNSCIFGDGLPVTLRFADAVGEILVAIPHREGPPLPFRHYI